MAHREEHARDLRFHEDALEYAKKLIREGKVDCDERNWTVSKPTPDSEDQYLSDHDYEEYGKWFLATREGTDEDTKEHYEFPIGDFDQVFRSGIIAAKQRAGQFKHKEVEEAASELLDMIAKHKKDVVGRVLCSPDNKLRKPT